MNFKTDKEKIKQKITKILINFLNHEQTFFNEFKISKKYFDHITKLTTSGKMVRGFLVCSSYSLFSKKQLSPDVLKIAAAMELLNTAILIHDDILDQDLIRRNIKTFNSVFNDQDSNYGNNIAMILGDITYALSFKLINKVEINSEIRKKIIQLFSTELAWVSFAQIDDYQSSTKDLEVTKDKILQLYENKTSRYSISLPLQIGALLAGKKHNKYLKQLAHYIGLIYQLKDDELDIFGNQTNKVGSDLKSGKKTFIYLELKNMLKKTNQTKYNQLLQSIFGKKNLTQSDIKSYKKLIIEHKVDKRIEQLINKYKEKITSILSGSKFDKEQIQFFVELTEYCFKRKK